jgi:hypothetical protein
MIELKREESDCVARYVELSSGDFGLDVPEEYGHGDAAFVYAMPTTRRM